MQTKSGQDIFPIGIGTWNIGGEGAKASYDNEPKEIEALRYSISQGQNHIDTAEMYGGFHTDEVVGKAIAGCSRQDLFIADKLWHTSLEDGLVRPTVDKMLDKLGTDYIDLLYIHFPWPGVRWQQAIPQIDRLIDEGVVRYFGVSSFSIKELEEAKHAAKHPIAANQLNYNLLHKSEANDEMRDYCQKNNIQLVAYRPTGRQEVLARAEVQEIARLHGCYSGASGTGMAASARCLADSKSYRPVSYRRKCSLSQSRIRF